MILKDNRTGSEKKYVLIPEDTLCKSNFVMPELFKMQYYCWYCQSENHLVYRKKKLSEMHVIGLLQILENHMPSKSALKVKETRIIENKFRK
jgi:hypothetical protein